MQVKTIVDEDFTNYKRTSMFIGTCYCDFKCCKEGGFGVEICQNSLLAQQNNVEVSNEFIFNRYINNNLSKCVVLGGLEPMLQFEEIYNLIKYFRENKCNDTIIIYSGYYKEEILSQLKQLKQFKNIIIKFGRYIPNHKPHYDEILGIKLASDNQYAEQIS